MATPLSTHRVTSPQQQPSPVTPPMHPKPARPSPPISPETHSKSPAIIPKRRSTSYLCSLDKINPLTVSCCAFVGKKVRRGVVVVLENRTDLTLTYATSSFASGKMHVEPPPEIPAHTACVYIVRNREVSFMTGVQGISIFESPLHSICIAFDSPYVGTYKSYAALAAVGTVHNLEFCMMVIHENGGSCRSPPYQLHYSKADMIQRFIYDHVQVERPPLTAPVRVIPLHVLQWNVFARPYIVSYDGQKERLERIPKWIRAEEERRGIRIDVVVLNELFIDEAETAQGFDRAGWSYCTNLLSGGGKVQNGGVKIFSATPVHVQEQYVYPGDATVGTDSLAAKGVLYAKIVKEGLPVHIFATHLQAWDYAEAIQVRARQLQHLLAFVQRFPIPATDTVLFAGDFNMDLRGPPQELDTLLRELKTWLPKIHGEQLYTCDHKNNKLCGRDGGDIDAIPGQWLDYVLPCSLYETPENLCLEAIPARTAEPFLCPWSRWNNQLKNLHDLSDHYPVLASMGLKSFTESTGTSGERPLSSSWVVCGDEDLLDVDTDLDRFPPIPSPTSAAVSRQPSMIVDGEDPSESRKNENYWENY